MRTEYFEPEIKDQKKYDEFMKKYPRVKRHLKYFSGNSREDLCDYIAGIICAKHGEDTEDDMVFVLSKEIKKDPRHYYRFYADDIDGFYQGCGARVDSKFKNVLEAYPNAVILTDEDPYYSPYRHTDFRDDCEKFVKEILGLPEIFSREKFYKKVKCDE